MHDHLSSDGARTSLHMQRRLPHPPERVWRALTEPDELRHWFPGRMSIDGDRIVYDFGPEGRVLAFDPPRLFAHTWGADELRWEIRPDGEASVLTLTHTFGDRFGAASYAAGWHTCVRAMAAVLDGRPVAGERDSARLHEEFVALLGLDGAQADGPGVRYERQLTRSAAQTWGWLSGEQARVGAPPPPAFVPPGVVAGAVVALESGKLVRYGAAGGTIGWELAEGTGQGPRLIVTDTAQAAPASAWRTHIEALSADLTDLPPEQTPAR
ncbi:SRPBCC family protein [Nonomuraea sp. NPDC050790]|uniref:SRPBCC family protein n=1 Tax=Nonomuraea sp. NPDC050790 TaxID=3364371 RepID=UPI0037AA854B